METITRLSRAELLELDNTEQLQYIENKTYCEIENVITTNNYDPEKIGTKAYYIFREVYKYMFKPTKADKVLNNQASILDYENDNLLIGVCNIFLDACTKYNILPLADLFSAYTGIASDTLWQWDNAFNNGGVKRKRSELKKMIIQSASQNTRQKLYSQGIGVIALANNDLETGLQYNRQKLIDGVAVQVLTSQALPKLSLNNSENN